MAKRKAKIIKDPKRRGEWVESVFMARAGEHGLAVSKPWGDSKSFDFVVGSPGKFVSVQVKSTTVKTGGGYMCTVKKNNQRYARGAFDFLAAYVIPEDVWYIVPAAKFAGRVTLILCSDSGEAKYEEFREAWELLKESTGSRAPNIGDEDSRPLAKGARRVGQPPLGGEPNDRRAPRFPRNAFERVQSSMEYVRRRMGVPDTEES
jgi:hypothetical protein